MTASGALRHIEALRSHGSSTLPKGFFVSERYHPWLPYARPDDNLFCSAFVAYTIGQYRHLLSVEDAVLADGIIAGITAQYPLFANKDGRETYNFWPTKPSRHFPNGYFMHRFEHFRIPDDADDTAYVALTTTLAEPDAGALRNRLISHAANVQRPIHNTWPEYRHLKAYSTFFGVNMYIEFDACVLTNVLLFVHVNFPQLNEHEIDAYHYLNDVVQLGKHRSEPFRVSANYPTTALIVYHLCRLLHRFPSSPLGESRAELEKDVRQLLATTRGMEKLLAHTSAMYLRLHVDPFDYSTATNDSDFYFFHAGMLTAFEQPWVNQYLAPKSMFHLRYRCAAINWALVFENVCLEE